jgi:hypothetical protein
MRRDNGAMVALGAVAALAGLAAASRRRGGRNEEEDEAHLRFDVEMPVPYQISGTTKITAEVGIWWDGRPETYPTRDQIVEAVFAQDEVEDYDDWLHVNQFDLRESVVKDVKGYPNELIEFRMSGTDGWRITPQNFQVTRGLGGRRRLKIHEGRRSFTFGSPPARAGEG